MASGVHVDEARGNEGVAGEGGGKGEGMGLLPGAEEGGGGAGAEGRGEGVGIGERMEKRKGAAQKKDGGGGGGDGGGAMQGVAKGHFGRTEGGNWGRDLFNDLAIVLYVKEVPLPHSLI